MAKLFDTENAFFEASKAELLKTSKDQYVLIKGKELLGTYSLYQDAVNEGFRRFGNQPFFVKQILEQDQVVHTPALTVGLISAHY